MGYKCREIIAAIKELAPESLAEDWDNVGLLLGGGEKYVNKLMLSLDVMPQVANEAQRLNVDMIVTHHPPIFDFIKRIGNDTPKGRLIYNLIKNDISVYAAHTNLDVCRNGLNDYLAEKLELNDIRDLSGIDGGSFLKSGRLAAACSLEEFIMTVKETLAVNNVRVVGNVDEISRVAVFCGGYDSELCREARTEADILVTGDIKYHDAQEIENSGFCAIDAGHFSTEVIVKELLFTYLKSRFPDLDIISSSTENDPFKFY